MVVVVVVVVEGGRGGSRCCCCCCCCCLVEGGWDGECVRALVFASVWSGGLGMLRGWEALGLAGFLNCSKDYVKRSQQSSGDVEDLYSSKTGIEEEKSAEVSDSLQHKAGIPPTF